MIAFNLALRHRVERRREHGSLYGMAGAAIPLVEDDHGVDFALIGMNNAESMTCQAAYDDTVTILEGSPAFNGTVEFNVPFRMSASWWKR